MERRETKRLGLLIFFDLAWLGLFVSEKTKLWAEFKASLL